MSLIKCKECNKKISTDVKACPHCGHIMSEEYRNKEINKKERAKIVGTIIIVIIIAYMIFSPKSPEKPKAPPETPQQKAIRIEQCKKSLSCWGDKNMGKAIYYCKDKLEQLPRFDYKWDDGYFDAEMFDSYKWADKDKLIITYVGHNLKIQNGFGAWRRAEYSCVYDTVNEKVLEVRMR